MSTVAISVRKNPYYNGTKVLDGNTYRLRFYWNLTTETWYLSIKGVSNTVEINGIALLPGKDLLAQHGYSQLGSLNVVDNSGADGNPEYVGFGSRWTLEYTEL